MRRVSPTPVLIVALVLCGCSADPTGRQVGAITGGATHAGHPAVGLIYLWQGNAWSMCSGTLVGQRTVLTAAHCVAGGAQAESVRFDSGEEVTVQSAARHPSYVDQHYTLQPYDDWYDFAILRLSRAPIGVTPHAVAAKKPPLGTELTLVGYGCTMCTLDDQGQDHCNEDEGVKRIATNSISRLTATELSFEGLGATCAGDSGGPAFARYQGREVQVGVTSRMVRPCGSGEGTDGRPDAVLDWIRSAAGGDVVVDETAPAGASGSDPPLDVTPPVVSFASPADGDVVRAGALAVKIAAFDVDLARVELFLDGGFEGTRRTPPFDFQIVVHDPGRHVLGVAAHDGAGNTSRASIAIEVEGESSDTKPLGAACAEHRQCQSGVCLQEEGARYCTAFCSATGSCGPGYRCQPTTDPSKHVCARKGSSALEGGQTEIVGGCVVAGRSPGPGPWLALLLAALARQRRRRQRDRTQRKP